MDLTVTKEKLQLHLERIYPDLAQVRQQQMIEHLLTRLSALRLPEQVPARWDHSTAIVISYADTVQGQGTSLPELEGFFERHLSEAFDSLHLLPFFTTSGDDGFSVIDYRQIPSEFGDWSDIQRMSKHIRVMGDLVLNHCSQQSQWFQGFLAGDSQYQTYFFEPGLDFDVSHVVRPRPQSVVQEYISPQGVRRVWATFSQDQVDLNYQNPDVLMAMLDVAMDYWAHGIDLLRLDAVAFLWKSSGSECINLPQTHEVVRLLRTLSDAIGRGSVIITETNLPNLENLSYFGNGNEAHWVYNFPLPPLTVYSLLFGDASPLRQWAMSLPPALPGMTYLNFLASHDGIGLRPTEGLLSDDEFNGFVSQIHDNGGLISYRAQPDGSQTPYEANITLFSALSKTTTDTTGQFAYARFMAAHAIMMAIEGVPAIYFHSLIGATNDLEGVEASGMNRRINREKFEVESLEAILADEASHASRILQGIKALLAVRQSTPAFHPNATQFTLQLPSTFFGVWRQSMDRRDNLFALTNMTEQTRYLSLGQLNLVVGDTWQDLLSDEHLVQGQTELEFAPYQTRWVARHLE